MRGGLLGLQVAVVGLLAHATAGLLAKEAGTPLLAVLAVVAAVAAFLINAAIVVAAAGLIGVAVEYGQRPRQGAGGA